MKQQTHNSLSANWFYNIVMPWALKRVRCYLISTLSINWKQLIFTIAWAMISFYFFRLCFGKIVCLSSSTMNIDIFNRAIIVDNLQAFVSIIIYNFIHTKKFWSQRENSYLICGKTCTCHNCWAKIVELIVYEFLLYFTEIKMTTTTSNAQPKQFA